MSAPLISIDTDFPIDFAGEIARLETFNKHHYRPNSYLHKWWARRCGSTFRLILKQLVEDEKMRDYYAPGGLAGKIILDPMMGGGTTLHEALRLGANVIGADLDPIPVLQARASLATIPLAKLEEAFQQFFQLLRTELDPLFATGCPVCQEHTPIRFTLHGLRRHCDCDSALFVDSLVLRQDSDGSRVRLCPGCHAVVQNSDSCSCGNGAQSYPLIEKGTKSCASCGGQYSDDLKMPFYARYEPLVIVGRCPEHNLFFKPLAESDRLVFDQANQARPFLSFDRSEFQIEEGRKSRQLILRGIDNYLDLFSSRQLIYLERTTKLLPHFESLVRLNLALLVSTSLEFNAMLSGYKGKNKRRAGAIRHTFSHHAYSFPYTAVENNPVYPRKSSGTLQKLFDARIRRARLWAQSPRERILKDRRPTFVTIAGELDFGEEVASPSELQAGSRRFFLRQGSSIQLDLADGSIDAVVTDPPYFDSVQYSDLAAFFRVWLRQMLPEAADWDYDIRESAVDPHKNDRASRYTELIGGIFAECHRVLRKENGRLIFTFHHWNPKGWAALTIALKNAGFVLLNRYVVHAENPISVHIANMNALTHDAILVLAPAEAARSKNWERPLAVNLDDSFQFCRDAATLLGWMLTADIPSDKVIDLWREALAPRSA
jgi:putative DNA methylase